MKISNRLKARFCKECNVPIDIYEEPYFSERLELYNRILDIKPKWERFISSLDNYETEEEYFKDYHAIKETIISHLKNNEAFKRFNNEDMNQFKVTNQIYKSKDVYNINNDRSCFISIDMVTANYTALRYYDKSIFDNTNTWEEFIARYTNNLHFIHSKYIRQVIMGACNPKQQVTYEKYLMDEIVYRLVNEGFDKQIESFSHDEIVVKIEAVTDPVSIAKAVAPSILKGINIRIVPFKLHKHQTMSGYTLFIDGFGERIPSKVEFKAMNPIDYPFRIREMLNEKVSEHDKVFMYEGRLAQFIN